MSIAEQQIDTMLAGVDWKPTGNVRGPDDLPVATHEGVLAFGGIELRVYQLDDGRRVFNADDVKFMLSPALGKGE